jgi:hypothetical protein
LIAAQYSLSIVDCRASGAKRGERNRIETGKRLYGIGELWGWGVDTDTETQRERVSGYGVLTGGGVGAITAGNDHAF